MAVTGRGRKANQDWALLLAQFEADYVPHNRTLREFCKDRELDEKGTSVAFSRERKRTALGVFHERNKPLLMLAQRQVYRAVLESVNWPDQVKAAEFNLKVLEKVAEREEPNPGLTQNLNVVMPPLFPESSLARQMVEALTGQAQPKEVKAARLD